MSTLTLLIICPDRPGIVAAVSEFVLERGGNIVHADQHTDRRENLFLQRVEWEGDVDGAAEAFAPLAERFDMTWRLETGERVPRAAVLVSKEGHCMFDLLARWQMGELPTEIPLVISNHSDLENDARRFDVDFHHLPVSRESKPEQETAIEALLTQHDVDLVVLARYMQILSPEFVERWQGRIINIHHSFLPAFAGARPYHQAYERGVKLIGATAHYVTSELDEGPIIAQDVARVSHRDEVSDMVRKGRDLEMVVLARAVRLHLENRVLVYGSRTVVFD